eukprot:1182288-Pleurochrysis_carterae.AAC.1
MQMCTRDSAQTRAPTVSSCAALSLTPLALSAPLFFRSSLDIPAPEQTSLVKRPKDRQAKDCNTKGEPGSSSRSRSSSDGGPALGIAATRATTARRPPPPASAASRAGRTHSATYADSWVRRALATHGCRLVLNVDAAWWKLALRLRVDCFNQSYCNWRGPPLLPLPPLLLPLLPPPLLPPLLLLPLLR